MADEKMPLCSSTRSEVEAMEVEEIDSKPTAINNSNKEHNSDISIERKSSFGIKSSNMPTLAANVYNITLPNHEDIKSLTNGENSKCIIAHQLGNIFNLFSTRGPDNDPSIPDSEPKLMFKDCGGLEKQIRFIQTTILNPLLGASPGQERFGLEPPKGVLFYGVPGTGKTRLALALSNEISELLNRPVTFVYRKGNDVASKWFGQSSENLRQVFEEAKQNKPSVLFFDELDGLCPSRDKPYMSEAYVTIVTTMLGLMDELQRGEVFVIGATNRMDAIDPALRRPGRFDKYLEFLPPTQAGRTQILSIHTDHWKLKPSSELLNNISQQTSGFSGADLAKLCLDTFDGALNRKINAERQLIHAFTYKNINLNNLAISKEDWQHALSKMKATTGGVFGSAQYIPQSRLPGFMQPLMQMPSQEFTTHLSNMIPSVTATDENNHATGAILSLFVWSNYNDCLSTIEDYLIGPTFGADASGHINCPKYFISPEILYSTLPQNWPKKVQETFSQAIVSQPSILYLSDVEELCQAIQHARLNEAINLKRQIERLRGTHVLLLLTGSRSPEQDLSWDNPFNDVLTETKVLEIPKPCPERRDAFFSEVQVPQCFEKEGFAGKIAELRKFIVKSSAGQDFGTIGALYAEMQYELMTLANSDDGSSKSDLELEQVIRKLYMLFADSRRTLSSSHKQM